MLKIQYFWLNFKINKSCIHFQLSEMLGLQPWPPLPYCTLDAKYRAPYTFTSLPCAPRCFDKFRSLILKTLFLKLLIFSKYDEKIFIKLYLTLLEIFLPNQNLSLLKQHFLTSCDSCSFQTFKDP